jgi:hypothetical protein
MTTPQGADVAHQFGGDIMLAPNGDIALASGTLLTRQRVLRRLLTNPGDYIWDVNYGAGLGAMVGQPVDAARVTAILRAQMFQEATVARSPLPAVSVGETAGGLVQAAVSYVDVTDGTAQNLAVVPAGM